ncbi:hypothetical protein BaRGS_00016074, partial [Batillaria attramentaria]
MLTEYSGCNIPAQSSCNLTRRVPRVHVYHHQRSQLFELVARNKPVISDPRYTTFSSSFPPAALMTSTDFTLKRRRRNHLGMSVSVFSITSVCISVGQHKCAHHFRNGSSTDGRITDIYSRAGGGGDSCGYCEER